MPKSSNETRRCVLMTVSADLTGGPLERHLERRGLSDPGECHATHQETTKDTEVVSHPQRPQGSMGCFFACVSLGEWHGAVCFLWCRLCGESSRTGRLSSGAFSGSAFSSWLFEHRRCQPTPGAQTLRERVCALQPGSAGGCGMRQFPGRRSYSLAQRG